MYSDGFKQPVAFLCMERERTGLNGIWEVYGHRYRSDD